VGDCLAFIRKVGDSGPFCSNFVISLWVFCFGFDMSVVLVMAGKYKLFLVYLIWLWFLPTFLLRKWGNNWLHSLVSFSYLFFYVCRGDSSLGVSKSVKVVFWYVWTNSCPGKFIGVRSKKFNLLLVLFSIVNFSLEF
jgi:hypothetical protein